MDEHLSRLHRQRGSDPAALTAFLRNRVRSGSMLQTAIDLAAGLGYEPALLIADEESPAYFTGTSAYPQGISRLHFQRIVHRFEEWTGTKPHNMVADCLEYAIESSDPYTDIGGAIQSTPGILRDRFREEPVRLKSRALYAGISLHRYHNEHGIDPYAGGWGSTTITNRLGLACWKAISSITNDDDPKRSIRHLSDVIAVLIPLLDPGSADVPHMEWIRDRIIQEALN